MVNHITDTFFIILLVIVVSIIIGLNIAKLVDNKINDVAINIPEIKVPKPIIKLQVSKNDKNNFVVCSENTDNNENKISNKEKFTVADANDFQNYNKIKNDTIKRYNNKDFKDQDVPENNNEKKKDKDNDKDRCKIIEDEMGHPRIIYPSKPVERVQKDGKVYVTDYDFGFEAPPHYVSCANSSIAQKWKTGKKSLIPYQISCDKPNKFTAENYYKVKHKIPVIPIIDYHIRGANYMNYINKVSPYKIDRRILSQTTKGISPAEQRKKIIPKGANYVDIPRASLPPHYPHNAPVRAMP